MPRPQFTIRALLVLVLAVACFVGGIRFEQERQWRGKEKIPTRPEFKLSREAAALKAAKKAMRE